MNNNTNTLLFKPFARHGAPFSLRYLHTGAVLLIALFLVGCMHAEEAPTQEGTATVSTAPTTAAVVLPTPTDLPLPPTTIPPTLTAAPTVQPLPLFHTVQDGETLLGLALTYSVPMAAIQLQNDLGEALVVRTGQVLEIPPSAEWEGASPFWVIHAVAEGETLTGIGQTYGVDTGELQTVNILPANAALQIGQLLILPLESPAMASAPAPTAAPTLPTPTTAPPSTQENEAAPAATVIPTMPLPAVPPPDDVTAWPQETVRLINVVRAEYGLPPLVYNETLAQAAQGQANDCSQRGWCSHTGSDGSDIKTRVRAVGYAGRGWAECWAQRKSPQGAVDVWMDEIPPNDPHRRTLLSTWLTEIGMGVAEAEWGYYYFIADFGRP